MVEGVEEAGGEQITGRAGGWRRGVWRDVMLIIVTRYWKGGQMNGRREMRAGIRCGKLGGSRRGWEDNIKNGSEMG